MNDLGSNTVDDVFCEDDTDTSFYSNMPIVSNGFSEFGALIAIANAEKERKRKSQSRIWRKNEKLRRVK